MRASKRVKKCRCGHYGYQHYSLSGCAVSVNVRGCEGGCACVKFTPTEGSADDPR